MPFDLAQGEMPNGGFNPASPWATSKGNVQLATDTESRAILGVTVTNEGTDTAGLSKPMREQVAERTGQEVEQHLTLSNVEGLDGGYFTEADLEAAHADGVQLFIPAKPARAEANRGRELEPKRGDSEPTLAWPFDVAQGEERMASDAGKQVYRERAATSEALSGVEGRTPT